MNTRKKNDEILSNKTNDFSIKLEQKKKKQIAFVMPAVNFISIDRNNERVCTVFYDSFCDFEIIFSVEKNYLYALCFSTLKFVCFFILYFDYLFGNCVYSSAEGRRPEEIFIPELTKL